MTKLLNRRVETCAKCPACAGDDIGTYCTILGDYFPDGFDDDGRYHEEREFDRESGVYEKCPLPEATDD